MTTYEIDLRGHLHGARYYLAGFVVFPLGLALYESVVYGEPAVDVLISTYGLTTLIWFLMGSPVLYLHLQYYFHDRGKRLTIDQARQIIELSSSEGMKSYRFDQILLVEGTWQRYFKNEARGTIGVYGFAQSFTDYFYHRLVFSDGASLIITSLMQGSGPIALQPTRTRFKLVPCLDNHVYSYRDTRRFLLNLRRREMTKYRDRFTGYSTERLSEIVRDGHRYDYAAVLAAREVLKNRETV